jgi:hypothetical protein
MVILLLSIVAAIVVFAAIAFSEMWHAAGIAENYHAE